MSNTPPPSPPPLDPAEHHDVLWHILMLAKDPSGLAAAARPLSDLTRAPNFRRRWYAAHAPPQTPSPYSWHLVQRAPKPEAEALALDLLARAAQAGAPSDAQSSLLPAAAADHLSVVRKLLRPLTAADSLRLTHSAFPVALKAGAAAVLTELWNNRWFNRTAAGVLPSPALLATYPPASLGFVLPLLPPHVLGAQLYGLLDATIGSAVHLTTLLRFDQTLASRAFSLWLKPRITSRHYRHDTLRAICDCTPSVLTATGDDLQKHGLPPAPTLYALQSLRAFGWTGALADSGSAWAWVRDAAFCGHAALFAELLNKLGGGKRLVSCQERGHMTYLRVQPPPASWPELAFAGWAAATGHSCLAASSYPVFGPGAPLEPPLGNWAGTLHAMLNSTPVAAGGAVQAAEGALAAVIRTVVACGTPVPAGFATAILRPLVRRSRPASLGAALFLAVRAHALAGPEAARLILSALQKDPTAFSLALPLVLQETALLAHATKAAVAAWLPLLESLLRHTVHLGATAALAGLRDMVVSLGCDVRVGVLIGRFIPVHRG